MRTTLIALTIIAASTANILAQRYETPAQERRGAPTKKERRAREVRGPGISGAIPRAVRSGNPLQMINPLAPARYGESYENVSFDTQVPGKWKGIILFQLWW